MEIRLKEERAKLKKELLAQFNKILEDNNTFHKYVSYIFLKD